MKKLLFIILPAVAIAFNSCKKSDFADAYADPATISSVSVENMFAGMLKEINDYTLPKYWRYFVVEIPTMAHYTQVLGWINSNGQYVPGSTAMNDRWKDYYHFLTQYRELQKVYAAVSDEEKTRKRIFMIAATIYFYDHSQQIADLYGDIPWSEAGMLGTNNGDYANSLPAYDDAASIYTTMLDDLKDLAGELQTISVPTSAATLFQKQDYINNGSVSLWQKYCNSLRLRILARASGVASFQSRVSAEMTEILGNPSQYPVISSNSENVQIDVTDLSSPINSTEFRSGLEDWANLNMITKPMADYMTANSDPRLEVLFDPNVNGDYEGLDPLDDAATQNNLINSNMVAHYDSATFNRNEYFPGVLMTAAEVSFIKAEAYAKGWASGDAKAAYETAIRQSVEFYYTVNALSKYRTPLTAPATSVIDNYLTEAGVSWDAAADQSALIATQKWIHFNIIQMGQNWAEVRRLNAPSLQFIIDGSSTQTSPPVRFLYHSNESILNAANYEAVKSKDNFTTKVFWDVN